jgi:hypothetical protein
MRSAGIFQMAALKSISEMVADRASPLRAAVNIVKASALADTASRFLSSAKKAGTSAYGMAAKCATGAILLGDGSNFSR